MTAHVMIRHGILTNALNGWVDITLEIWLTTNQGGQLRIQNHEERNRNPFQYFYNNAMSIKK